MVCGCHNGGWISGATITAVSVFVQSGQKVISSCPTHWTRCRLPFTAAVFGRKRCRTEIDLGVIEV